MLINLRIIIERKEISERTNKRTKIDRWYSERRKGRKGRKEGKKERKKDNLNSAAEHSTAAVIRL